MCFVTQLSSGGKKLFREMMRKKQQLSQEECKTILKQQLRGVLSVLGDDDYPYGMPINHYYCEEDGKLYFHGGRKGHKRCYETARQGILLRL